MGMIDGVMDGWIYEAQERELRLAEMFRDGADLLLKRHFLVHTQILIPVYTTTDNARNNFSTADNVTR
jgi:hypothetical protein